MPLGIYISVPFCKSKCSFCNFASGVFSRDLLQCFVDRVCNDMAYAGESVAALGGVLEREVETIYVGGGTPTTLAPEQLSQLFTTLRNNFAVLHDAEITVECAPGTLSPAILDTLARSRVNRVSLGVQSFVDHEARSVGRLHNRETVLADIQRLREAGIHNIGVDLIAGLPHQTSQSWKESLDVVLSTGVPHVSVYILEVDADSRLGREVMAGGTRYHAHHVPDDDRAAEFYLSACERLSGEGIAQYEISNFAQPGFQSKHNLKYWTRQPYLGFGLDAHSMLLTAEKQGAVAVRFSTTDDLPEFLSSERPEPSSIPVALPEALEEEFFLGLRLNRGIHVEQILASLGIQIPASFVDAIAQSQQQGLLQRGSNRISLTPRGRLLSNEVFARFIGIETQPAACHAASC